MTPYTFNGPAWQESWDRQQEAYLPDREERFAAMLDAVEAVTEWPAPRILDLAGGTGSISLRAQRRFPQANTTLLDLDPVTLTIARATLDERSTVVTADLVTPEWTAALPHRDYDAVLAATALHWLSPERLATLYAEVRTVLRPGGILVNADYMPDDGLPELSKRLGDRADARREARYAAGAVLSWSAWWEHAKSDPTLAPLVEERNRLFPGDHHQEWLPPASWHVRALRDAGFTEAGLIWRGAQDAAVVGVR
ncbi:MULTISPECIES: class I SAM-dependent methyltransferase [Catenuloplanes]|uniref:Trans-aconitate methyltransferase n=1 Tax=Catenuloplanes niger TaxID=587534 RepID=A0AAE4CSY4_9ACTN|nr:class I SAM-dependent methyltransferase [Catenuloplanes niger]MDR7321763.1 trans-aconitate methyltransferase [Catenuloplanes niger]